MSTDKEWLTTEQVAELANRTPYTIRRHVRDGKLKARRDPINGRIYVHRDDAQQRYRSSARTTVSIDAPGNFRGVLLD